MNNKYLHKVTIDRRLSVAPMLDWTDRHCRYFLRLISRHTLLYTEMITTGALIHGDRDRFLRFDESEHPLAIQLGGSEPTDLAACSRMAEQRGFDEVNLNVGCPSDRVQSGRFGACLMMEPWVVADCIKAIADTTTLPITVKHRIGVDEHDSYDELCAFVGQVAEAGCNTFIVHARKAWLKGLSPKENREIPPLDYPLVYQLKRDFPNLEIIINGGIKTLAECELHLQHVDGVMIGREAYHNPWILAEADQLLFGDNHPVPNRHSILEQLLPYVEHEQQHGIPVSRITRHILGLFQGQPRARAWRRHISENAHRKGADSQVILDAASLVNERI